MIYLLAQSDSNLATSTRRAAAAGNTPHQLVTSF